MLSNSVFAMPFTKMKYPALTTWLLDTATLQEAHPFHGVNWPEWVAGKKEFRAFAATFPISVQAAENRDREKLRDRDLIHREILTSIDINANYIITRAHYEKDESLLHNSGYMFKEMRKKYLTLASVSNVPLILKVKTGPDKGEVTLKFEKDTAAGLYLFQLCKGEPAGEESWRDGGTSKNCQTVVRMLDRANWYYFRFRAQGNNECTPWSEPVGIIVV